MSGRVRPEHESLIRLVRSIAQEEAAAVAPKVGTVVGSDGGRPTVRLDDEDEDGAVGLARQLGHRYPKGSRVLVGRLRPNGRAQGSYDHVVLGIVSDKQGNAEEVVGNEDIQANSINSDRLAPNVRQRIDDAASQSALDNLSGRVDARLADVVKANQLAPNATGGKALATEDWATGKFATSNDITQLLRRVAALEKKVGKKAKDEPA